MKAASTVRRGAGEKGLDTVPRQRPTLLYGSETARGIAARKGLKRGQQILDWMGPDELAANLFRASLTEQRLRSHSVDAKAQAYQAHHHMGADVRQFIIEHDGTPPEQLPTPEVSIRELQKREQQRIEAERQPSLWSADEQEKH